MSFHGRAPQRIQDAMYGLVPRDSRKMYSPTEVDAYGAIYGDRARYDDIQPGQLPDQYRVQNMSPDEVLDKYRDAVIMGQRNLEAARQRKLYSPTEVDEVTGTSIYGNRERYEGVLGNQYQPTINQQSAPSTAGNVPMNQRGENYSSTYETFQQPPNVFNTADVERTSSPSTAGNAPAKNPLRASLPRGVDPATQAPIDARALPDAGAKANAQQIAKTLINDKLRAGAVIAAAGLTGGLASSLVTNLNNANQEVFY